MIRPISLRLRLILQSVLPIRAQLVFKTFESFQVFCGTDKRMMWLVYGDDEKKVFILVALNKLQCLVYTTMGHSKRFIVPIVSHVFSRRNESRKVPFLLASQTIEVATPIEPVIWVPTLRANSIAKIVGPVQMPFADIAGADAQTRKSLPNRLSV